MTGSEQLLVPLAREVMLERMLASDARADGQFITGVLSTGIYCLPSCGARKPRPENVRFFATPADAAQAGLRPCKRCGPDQMYRPVEEQERRADQFSQLDFARTPTLSSAAAQLGVAAGDLEWISRRHFHVSASIWLRRRRADHASRALCEVSVADALRACGFTGVPALCRALRAAGYPTPAAHNDVQRHVPFTLPLPRGYPHTWMLAFLGRDHTRATAATGDRRVHLACEVPSGPVGVTVEFGEHRAHAHVTSGPALTPDDAHALLSNLRRVLGLSTPALHAENLRGHLAWQALGSGPWSRVLPLTPTLFDGLIWAVVGQQVTFTFACELRRRLLTAVGERVSADLLALPTPARLAALSESDLTGLGFTRARAALTLSLARSFSHELSSLEVAPVGRAARTLQAIPGFGPWSVQYVLLRVLGFLDACPASDAALRRALKTQYALPATPSAADSAELMAPFAPFRGLATLHFWRPLSPTSGDFHDAH